VAAQPSSNTAADTRNYLRTAEVADILHVSPKTVSRWAKEGKLPFLAIFGRWVLHICVKFHAARGRRARAA
jgi:excisionase family DNA binding protein